MADITITHREYDTLIRVEDYALPDEGELKWLDLNNPVTHPDQVLTRAITEAMQAIRITAYHVDSQPDVRGFELRLAGDDGIDAFFTIGARWGLFDEAAIEAATHVNLLDAENRLSSLSEDTETWLEKLTQDL
ncbi:hypothetical protein GC177_05200 [bacterium]|nr:hypothetical protein [bacterium]